MLVYGDHETTVDPRACLAEIERRLAALAPRRGIDWHANAVAAFIDVVGLLQGLADAAFLANGHDDVSADQDALMAVLVAMAHAIDASWTSGFARQSLAPDTLAPLDAIAWPPHLTIRRCEGYAYYALYPELYLHAARSVPAGSTVIGLRSIGTGLAALVASVCEARAVFTVRPSGDVFARRVIASDAIAARVRAAGSDTFVIVDEGPGLSGSSFGGVADWLEGLGVAPHQIMFLPGHGGALGLQASPPHRERWSRAHRSTGSFDDQLVQLPEAGIAHWFADLTGPPTIPLRDVSGGAWRAGRDLPADPAREARKFVLTTARGDFLLKFAGLDRAAEAKFARARALFAAGFTPEPLALRYGMLCERWLAAEPRSDTPPLAEYLAFRAAAFPAQTQGASLATLVDMARYNIGQMLGPDAEALFTGLAAKAAALQPHVHPVHVDSRLHRWEWVPAATGWLKTDAIDHSEAHDLIGCQDIAWDVAGAIVEWDLSPAQSTALVAHVMPGRAEAADLTALMTLCYVGFQIGWWTYSGDPSARILRDGYAARAAAMLAAPPSI